MLREEEEESDNEDGNQGKTNPIRALDAPPVPPSDPTVTASQQPSPLRQSCVTQKGGRSGGDQVSNSMESHSRAEATTTDEPHDVQDRFGSDDAHAVDGRADAMGRERVLENESEMASRDMDVDQSNLGDKNYDMAKGKDMQDRIGNEDAHTVDGRVNAMGREKASRNQRERATQDMDVDQSNPGDKGYDVAKAKGTGLRRSDRKRKTPPPPEREGKNRGKPKPASRNKAKSKEQPSKLALKPEPGRKSNPHRDAGGIERNYFEEIEIGATSRLVDMIDLTQDMVSHLSIHTDTLY